MKHTDIMRKYWIVPNKSLGQNFLVNDGILEKISNSIQVSGKNILEVWPWYWALTHKILEKWPKSLTLVELDKNMVSIIEDRINNDFSLLLKEVDFKVFNTDVLKYIPTLKEYSLIANIPYYITSPILFHFMFSLDKRPDEMVILMQKDVWDKILKKNWNKSSVLSLYCEMASESITEITRVWAGNFIPAPKVESSVLHFKLKWSRDINLELKILEIIKLGYSERRKKLSSNLSKKYSKESILALLWVIWINQDIRAESLSIDDWIKITNSIC